MLGSNPGLLRLLHRQPDALPTRLDLLEIIDFVGKKYLFWFNPLGKRYHARTVGGQDPNSAGRVQAGQAASPLLQETSQGNHSELWIRDDYPGSEFFPSLARISDPNFFHPGSRIRIKEFKYFNPKKIILKLSEL
jgi:hypothetical protein